LYVCEMIRGCKLYLEYILHKVKRAITVKHPFDQDGALQLLAGRLREVMAQVTKWANASKQEGRQEASGLKQGKFIQLTTSLDNPDLAPDELEGLQREQHMLQVLGVDARMELTLTAACMDACDAIINLLRPGLHGCPMPVDPTSKAGRDLACAIEQTLLRAFVIGMIIPPTRVCVLHSCKWGWVQDMESMVCPRKELATSKGYKCSDRSCPGNVIWIPGPTDMGAKVVVDWRHHKSAEHNVERVFSVRISDSRMNTLLKAWCVWARHVLYFGQKDYPHIQRGLDDGWVFMNKWTASSIPKELSTSDFTKNYRKICHINKNFDCQKV
jgi:hypothetical protein